MYNRIKKLLLPNPDPGVQLYQKLYSIESVNEKKFYNLGAGSFFHPCWTNVDAGDTWYKKRNGPSVTHLMVDFFDHESLPIADASAELVYCSHILEHLDNITVEYIFNEVFRILKKGGVFRIVTPDIDLAYRAWKRNDIDFFYWVNKKTANKNIERMSLKVPLGKASISQVFLEDFAAAASEIAILGADQRISDEQLHELFKNMSYEEALNYCTSFCTIEMQRKLPFRHMNWFNQKKLQVMLNKKGFNEVLQSAYLQSNVPVLRNSGYFDITMPQVSLYVEAVK